MSKQAGALMRPTPVHRETWHFGSQETNFAGCWFLFAVLAVGLSAAGGVGLNTAQPAATALCAMAGATLALFEWLCPPYDCSWQTANVKSFLPGLSYVVRRVPHALPVCPPPRRQSIMYLVITP